MKAEYEKLISEIKVEIERHLKALHTPSVGVCIVKDGEVLLADGFGYSDPEHGVKSDADTLYMIGSCTKAMTSTVLAMLAEQGLIDFDEPIRNYIPELQFSDPYINSVITLRDILSHRSGLPGHELFWLDPDRSMAEMVKNIKYLPFNKPFRTTFQYNNLLYGVAGYIIERLTGMKWFDAMKKYLYEPLGMVSTVNGAKEMLAAPKKAVGYTDGMIVKNLPVPHSTPYTESRYEKHNPGEHHPISPAGFVACTPKEIAGWLLFNLREGEYNGKKLISPEMLYEVTKPSAIVDETYPGHSHFNDMYDAAPGLSYNPTYGCGWGQEVWRGHRRYFHGGSIAGFHSDVAFIPDMDLGIAVFCNELPSPTAHTVAVAIMDRFMGHDDIDWVERYIIKYHKMYGDPEKIKAAVKEADDALPARPLSEYTGVYHCPGYEATRVVDKEGKLFIMFGDEANGLQHVSGDTYMFDAESELPTVPVFFRSKGDGKIGEMVFTLNSEQVYSKE